MASFDVLRLHERGDIIVVDVRSAAEVLAAFPARHLIQIQFGPDEWGPVADGHVATFLKRLRPLMTEGKPVALLCQRGVRSEAAARLLAARGVSVTNVLDGYLGNRHGPGWRAWE